MSVWTEIVCDQCAETFGAGSNSPTELRRDAKRQGWIKRTENGRLKDYCPDCKGDARRILDRDSRYGTIVTRKDGRP